MRVRERSGRPFPVAVGQWWARSWLVSGLWRTSAQDRPSGAAIYGADLIGRYFRSSQACNRIWAEGSGPAVSRWVQLGTDAWRTGFLTSAQLSVGQRGPLAEAECLLNVLAGDLVAAGYAVRVDAEQHTHAVPSAGSDLGGRGAGGPILGWDRTPGPARRLLRALRAAWVSAGLYRAVSGTSEP
jgi:hypothetical protein